MKAWATAVFRIGHDRVMSTVPFAVFYAIAISALTLQPAQPVLPITVDSTPDSGLPDGFQATANALLQSGLPHTVPISSDGTITLPPNILDISLSTPSSEAFPLRNDTLISIDDVSGEPQAPPELISGSDPRSLPSGWQVSCSQLLGTHLRRVSCLEAWDTFPVGGKTLSLGPRGEAKYDVALPKRYLGCMLLRHLPKSFLLPSHCGAVPC